MPSEPIVYVVDDDDAVRDSLTALLDSAGYRVAAFESAEAFLRADPLQGGKTDAGCIVSDIRMPGLDGLQLQEKLNARQVRLPLLFITGHGDVPIAVSAMKAGAVDFLEKPFDETTLLDSIRRAIEISRASQQSQAEAAAVRERIGELTQREREVMVCLAQGKQNKVVALELGISPRTVEIHRARVMEKMAARSLSDVVRAAISAGLI
jgi:two-component system, LuxR family, response regulator FixJ